MQNSEHSFGHRSLSRLWLLLGVGALGIAGLYSLVLVVARTPSLAKLPLFTRLFHEALVVHVDLSVLVWFLSIACLLWSLMARASKPLIPMMEEAALACFALGTLLIAASPLDGRAEALMSNYIPVISSPAFFMGLALLLCGIVLMLVHVLLAATKADGFFDIPMQFGLLCGALITMIAIAAFFWSYHAMPTIIDGGQYYEIAFWGGGHVLQFTHTQILMVCWLLVARALKPGFMGNEKFLFALFGLGLLAAFTTPLGYIGYEVTSFEHRNFFTNQMIVAGGIAPTIFALCLLPLMWKHRAERKGKNRALLSTLFMSVLLFLYGGVLAGMIQGQNVVIPAHYHGSIVGVTLGFMAAAYLLLPRFGYKPVAGTRLAYWQPIVYGGGQLMHISGLAWSGGYGVLRKTPGVINEISPAVKAAMGLMGGGGLLAIIGGIMFVAVVCRSVSGTKA